MSPKITFIVSAFNRPLALNLCLLSLILQVEERWEAIVTDNSSDEAMNWRHQSICGIDKRIRYLHTADVAGTHCYYAANYAAQFATGEFIGFPSDDSYYTPEYADKLIRLADACNLELVFCDLVMTGKDNGGVLNCQAAAGHIDKTNFLVKRSRFNGFPLEYCGDGALINQLVAQGIVYGKIGHPLAIHNTNRPEGV